MIIFLNFCTQIQDECLIAITQIGNCNTKFMTYFGFGYLIGVIKKTFLMDFFLEFKTVINLVEYRNMRYEYFETRDKEIRHDRKDRRTQGVQDIRQPYPQCNGALKFLPAMFWSPKNSLVSLNLKKMETTLAKQFGRKFIFVFYSKLHNVQKHVYVFLPPLPKVGCPIFFWADAFYKSKCLSV